MKRKYIHRQLEPLLLEAATQFPAIVLTGPRQTGKSTLLQHIFSSHHYISLDDPILRQSAKEDPALFLENYPPPCIIDEIQYVPELFPYIKMEIDKKRDLSGQYILTGSQIFPLMRGLTESLAGRIAVFELYGFSLDEFPENGNNISMLFERIFTGTYPDPLVHKVNRNLFYSSYLQTYLERDIRQIQNVQDLSQFQHFLELLSGRVGSLLNLSEISKELGISQPTVKRWLSLLENSRIIYLLRPYFKNLSKRIIKSPKPYFMDTGLLSYLLKYPDSKTLASGPLGGAMLENFIISEVIKHKTNRNIPFEIYFYRDSNKNEIDLVIDRGYKQDLCEIKLNKSIQKKHYKQLQKLKGMFTDPSLYLISAFDRGILLAEDVKNLPAWKIHKLGS